MAQYKPGNSGPGMILRPPIPKIQPPTPSLGVKIRPSQAAAIAQSQVPNAKVVGVKLLPGGVYAVTLRTDTSVERVMVNGDDGSIN